MIDAKDMNLFLGKWKLGRELGSGMSGQVYQIYCQEQTGERTTSALKYIHIPSESALEKQKEIQSSQQDVYSYFLCQVKSLEEEIAFQCQCSGQNNFLKFEEYLIIENSEEIGWDILIRMELLQPINTFFGGKQATQYDVIKMCRDIANALSFSESLDIIYRGLKPEDILIASDGSYKLSDFQLSLSMENRFIRGKMSQYMAPEVSYKLKYDERAVYYSLGYITYFFLNKRRPPFYPEYPEKICEEDILQAEERRTAGEKVPGIPWVSEDINDIILKCLEYERSKRYKCATDLYNAFDKLLQEQGESLKMQYLNGDIYWNPSENVVMSAVNRKSHVGSTKKIFAFIMAAVMAGIVVMGGIWEITNGLHAKYGSENIERTVDKNGKENAGFEGTQSDGGQGISNEEDVYIPDTDENHIIGIEQNGKYTTEMKITITAIGAGMDIANPIEGDIRYQPSNWGVLESREWGDESYSATFRMGKSGNYILTVNYNQQQFDGQRWVDTGKTDTKTVEFHIA